MQRLSTELIEGERSRRQQLGAPRGKASAINRIAQQGMPDMGHVHANLMGPAGFEGEGQQTRHVAEHLLDFIVRDGSATTRRPHNRHTRAMRFAPPEISFHSPARLVELAPNHGRIVPLQPAIETVARELL